MKTTDLLSLVLGFAVLGFTGCATTKSPQASVDPKAGTPPLESVAAGPEDLQPEPLRPRREIWWSSPRMQLQKPVAVDAAGPI